MNAPQASGWKLGHVVDELLVAISRGDGGGFERAPLPSRDRIAQAVAALRTALFPFHFGAPILSEGGVRDFVGHTLDEALHTLEEQVLRALVFTEEYRRGSDAEREQRARELTRAFALRLPDVRALLGSDVRAAYQGDPSATGLDETLFCYPGVTAITHYRLAHVLHGLGVPLLARIISELAHSTTGVDIHPGARIGGSFFINHGTGIVIGETTVIGQRVRIYQGVTLGAKSPASDKLGAPRSGVARHPIVEDDVVIHAGATILGPVTIGRGSSVGGNVWLTRGVPAGSRITQAHVRSEVFDGGAGI